MYCIRYLFFEYEEDLLSVSVGVALVMPGHFIVLIGTAKCKQSLINEYL